MKTNIWQGSSSCR